MGMVITGGILSGSDTRPDLAMAMSLCQKEDKTLAYKFDPIVSNWDLAGWIPIASTFSGLGKVLVALVHTICHVVLAIFVAKSRAHHWEETKLGFKNLLNGLIEIVPLFGNLIRFIDFAKRVDALKVTITTVVEKAPQEYIGKFALFVEDNAEPILLKTLAIDSEEPTPKLAQVHEIIKNNRLKKEETLLDPEPTSNTIPSLG